MADDYDYFADFSPETIQALVDSGMFHGQSDLAAHLMKRGIERSKAPMPEGRFVRDQFVASSPLEVLAAAQERQRGFSQEQEQQLAIANLLRKHAADAKTYYSNLKDNALKARSLQDTSWRQDPWLSGGVSGGSNE
jgi:hypothetical protein